MGSDVTPSDKRPLAGVLVPHAFATSSTQLAADYAEGTDYHHFATALGYPTSDADTAPRLRLLASGTADSGVSQRQARVVRGGGLGPGGVGVVVRGDSGDNWQGRDAESSLTGYSIVSAATGTLDRAIIALSDGTVRAFRATLSGGTVTVSSHLMATDGSWSSEGTRWSYPSSYTWAGFCVIRDPAGDADTFLAYTQWESGSAGTTIACLRSTNKGSTWTLQSRNVLPAAVSTTAGIRTIRAAARAGQVLLCYTAEAGTSSETGQYLSSDGGYTFEEIVAPAGEATVWDLIATPVGFVCSFTFKAAGTVYHYAHTVASGRSNIIDATNGTQLSSGVQTDQYAGAALVVVDSGRVRLHGCGTVVGGGALGTSVRHWYSDDYGATWTDDFSEGWGPTKGPAVPRLVAHRGRVLRLEDNLTISGSTYDGRNYLTVWGGLSDVTLTQDVPVSDLVHYASKTLTADGFVDTGTGTPTYAVHATYAYSTITCGASDTVLAARTYDNTSAEGVGAARLIVQATSGTSTLTVDAGATTIDIDLTSTQIRAYEQGGSAPSYTSHSVSGFLDIICAIAPGDGEAYVAYREWDEAVERAYTTLTTITGATTGAGTSILQISMPNSAVLRVKALMAGSSSGTANALLPDGISRPGDLDVIELSPSRGTYIGGGLSVRGQGGPGFADGSVYTIPVTSNNPKEYLLPQVQPSPARPAKLTNAAQTLRFTLEPDNGSTGTYAEGQLFGVYLGGLYGVGQVSAIYDTASGSTLGSVELRTSFDYQLAGNVVRVDRASADSDGRYIAANELEGWTFEDDGGEVRTVLGNTEGTLQAGSTVDTKRVMIRLDGIDGTETATGAGKLYPKQALILIHGHGDTTFEQLRITLAAHTGHTHKEIGILAAGWVHVLGRGIDRNHSLAIEAGAEITTYPDGSRTATARQAPRRRLEVAFVDSHVDLSDVWASESVSPDYVVVSDNASSEPAATRFGVPLTVEGVWKMAGGSRHPVVFLPGIPHDTAGTTRPLAYTLRHCEGALYGRIMSPYRRTRTPFGTLNRTDGYRTSTLAIEEEL